MKRLTEMPPRYPNSGTFELTVRCNLHCKMCLFRHADSETAQLMRQERTAAEWIDMARQAAEAGTLHLLITGGEPLLRPDFCEIWEGIYRQGFVLALYTNAVLVTPEIMRTLRRCPPHKIGVTLYGASAETYEAVCGDGAAFEKTLCGLEQLMQLPSKLEIRTTLIRDNVDDLPAMEQLVRERFGYDRHIVQSEYVIAPVRGGCAPTAECRLSPAENIRATMAHTDRKIAEYFARKNMPVPEYSYTVEKTKQTPSGGQTLTLFDCNAGMDSYTISYDGRLLGCQLLGACYTQPFETGFATAWERFPYEVHIPAQNPACGTCEVAEDCTVCCAVRAAETGQLNGCPDYFRQMAYEMKHFDDKRKADHTNERAETVHKPRGAV